MFQNAKGHYRLLTNVNPYYMIDDRIRIPLSKRKLILALLGSLLLVVGGFWMVSNPERFQSKVFSNHTFIFLTGMLSITFFGTCGFYISKKLADPRPGLIIDGTGITDNTSGISAGFIPWSDIKEFKTAQVINQKFIMVIVYNPENYIERQTNSAKRNAVTINYKGYGSPVSISANALKCNFSELEGFFKQNLKRTNQ